MNNFLKTILLTCIFVAVPCILYAQIPASLSPK